MHPKQYTRFNIVGTSGCGKSSFARALAQRLNYPCIEMDLLYWKANWQEPTDPEFFARLQSALQPDCWVLDGNYTRTTAIKWSREVCVIWLDYSFPRVFFQALRRALNRAWTKQELWPDTNNRETFKQLLFSKKSILLWTLQTFHANRKKYRAMMSSPQYQHIHFIRLSDPTDAKRWLEMN